MKDAKDAVVHPGHGESAAGPAILFFACRWCAMLGAERAGRDRIALDPCFRIIPVECAGAVPQDIVLRAFAEGAEGIAVLGCHLGGCHHNQGNRAAHARLSLLHAALESVGIRPERLLLSFGTAHEGHQFAALCRDFVRQIREMKDSGDLDLLRGTFSSVARYSGQSSGQFCWMTDFNPAENGRKPLPPELVEEAGRLLATGQAQYVLALKESECGVVPEVFSSPEDLAQAVQGPKYPLAKTFWRFMRAMPQGTKAALACRHCDWRALEEQKNMNQYEGQEVLCLTFPCDARQAHDCSCANPGLHAEKKSPADALSPDLLRTLSDPNRADVWLSHMQRCIKCFGCRNACPICVCPTCRLEDEIFVPPGILPPPPLPWHLCRALHVADRCVGCGACQDACPAGIPLLAIHNALARRLHAEDGYLSGYKQLSPLNAPMTAEGPCGGPPPSWPNFTGRNDVSAPPTSSKPEEQR